MTNDKKTTYKGYEGPGKNIVADLFEYIPLMIGLCKNILMFLFEMTKEERLQNNGRLLW